MRTVEFVDGQVHLIDQTLLPWETEVVKCTTFQEVAESIRAMRVRGAPAIGVAAAYAMALGARAWRDDNIPEFVAHMEQVAVALKATRPTAVNLAWAVDQAVAVARRAPDLGVAQAARDLLDLAHRLAESDVAANRSMGAHGASLIPEGANILTHCNAGALATVDYGTALGVVRAAWESGKRVHVFVDETRPFLQGARLTAWELEQAAIPYTLITDNMAGHLMARGQVDVVLVGADRIAANGDVANKIGTYTLAVLAKENGIPLYVVAPTSSIDVAMPTGAAIPIEERDPEEVRQVLGRLIAPAGAHAIHPAFDVTPHRFVTALVTEKGVLWPPYSESIAGAVSDSDARQASLAGQGLPA